MPQLLRDVKPLRVLAVIRTHASPHAIVEIADKSNILGWYAKPSEYLPQQLSVIRVVRFLQIDEAHVQGRFPLSSELLQSAYDEQHINRWLCGAEAALLFLQEKFLGFAEVAEAGRDDFQQNFACVGNKRNPSEVVAISSIPLFLEDVDDDRILPLLGDLSCSPNIDKELIKALGECGVIDFQEFGRETIWLDSFPIWHPLKCFGHLVHGWFTSEPQYDGMASHCQLFLLHANVVHLWRRYVTTELVYLYD
ncbi:MAG: hypothetical protein ABJZ69_01675 [Hyphomicrobiales bacterium]